MFSECSTTSRCRAAERQVKVWIPGSRRSSSFARFPVSYESFLKCDAGTDVELASPSIHVSAPAECRRETFLRIVQKFCFPSPLARSIVPCDQSVSAMIHDLVIHGGGVFWADSSLSASSLRAFRRTALEEGRPLYSRSHGSVLGALAAKFTQRCRLPVHPASPESQVSHAIVELSAAAWSSKPHRLSELPSSGGRNSDRSRPGPSCAV